MNKKIARIGKKAGLGDGEVRNFVRIGVSGLIAVALSIFTGSAQAGGADKERLTPPFDLKPQAKEPLPEKCRLKPDGGPCKALFWKYYFDPKTNECKEFVYGGCEGVVPFETREECAQECLEQQAEPVIPDDDCGGPFPGYPCGTKYYTVSVRDFRHFSR